MKPNRRLKLTRIPRMDATQPTHVDSDNIDNLKSEETEAIKAAEAENAEVTPVTLEYTEQDESALAPSTEEVTDDTAVFTPVSEDSTVVFDAVSSDTVISEYSAEETEAVSDVSAYAPAYVSLDDELEQLTADDVDPEGKSRRSGFPLFSIIRYLMIVVCLCIFSYCAFLIAQNIIDKGRGNVIYSGLADEFFSIDDGSADDGSARMDQVSADNSAPTVGGATDHFINIGGNKFTYTPDITSSDNPFDSDPAKMVANLNKLKEFAKDLYGWVYIEGTRINYPLVQGADNTYYLSHAPEGVDLSQGSIFVDYRCNTELMRNFNTVLYGHNMKDGQMFHDVEKFYKNEDLFRNSRVIVCTFDGVYYFEPFAVFHTSYDTGYNETGFPTYDAFLNFVQKMQKMSVYNKGLKFAYTDRLLTLSTCTNGIKTDRYGLMCVLTEYNEVK